MIATNTQEESMKSGLYGATEEAREKIKGGHNPFKKGKKGCGCSGDRCASPAAPAAGNGQGAEPAAENKPDEATSKTKGAKQ